MKKLKDLEMGAFFIYYPVPAVAIEKGYPVQIKQLVAIETTDLNQPLPFPKGIKEHGLVRRISDELLESEVVEIFVE
ncbi:MAG TPA: hypothetical protein VMC41_03345 [Candidatus Nanoarchaeia archaeon]|nr:hypothetical protein [Candidatus Nanoarchaeia archaeon]